MIRTIVFLLTGLLLTACFVEQPVPADGQSLVTDAGVNKPYGITALATAFADTPVNLTFTPLSPQDAVFYFYDSPTPVISPDGQRVYVVTDKYWAHDGKAYPANELLRYKRATGTLADMSSRSATWKGHSAWIMHIYDRTTGKTTAPVITTSWKSMPAPLTQASVDQYSVETTVNGRWLRIAIPNETMWVQVIDAQSGKQLAMVMDNGGILRPGQCQ